METSLYSCSLSFSLTRKKFQRKHKEDSSNRKKRQDLPVLNALLAVPVSLQDAFSLEMDDQKADVCPPKGVLEEYLRSLDSTTSTFKATTSGSEYQQHPKGATGWRRFLRMLKSRSTRSSSSLHPLYALKQSIGSRSLRDYFSLPPTIPLGITDSKSFKSFTLAELHNATNNFNNDNVIGKGGYAEVYKGSLQDGQRIAIKRLIRGTADERIKDFLSELGIMAHVFHPNVTRLIGYGVEGGLHLVLQLSENGSLASVLHGSKERLQWGIRYKIALGAARGLLYLHQGCQRRIIHRDIKAANILLKKDYDPQICDFGLAKWLPEQWTQQTVSKFEGTFGYLAPEYLMHGIVDEKTDVFAYGVLLLELITGRRALDYSQQSLVMWAKPLLRKKSVRELADPSLGENYISREMNLLVTAAASCVRQSSMRRPEMSQVVKLLEGDIGSLEGISRQQHTPFFQKSLVPDDRSIKGSNALNHHKHIALELEL